MPLQNETKNKWNAIQPRHKGWYVIKQKKPNQTKPNLSNINYLKFKYGLSKTFLFQAIQFNQGHSVGEVLPLCRGAVSIFYSPSWLGKSSVLIDRLCS